MKNSGVALVILTGFVLSGLLWMNTRPRSLLETESVIVTSQGRAVCVYDRLSGREYVFRMTHICRSQAAKTAYTAVDSETIKVVILPRGGLEITSNDKVYIITSKWGGVNHGKESHG